MVHKLKILAVIALCLPLCGAWPNSGKRYPSGFTGPGDVVSGAYDFWGLRAYTASIANGGTTAAANFTRASDSHTCDVLLISTGGLGNTANCSTGADNGTAIATWCNATTCSANTLYDQTGNTNCNAGAQACSLLQATVANQPALAFNCVSTLPCLAPAGSASMVTANSANAQSQPITVTAEAERTGAFTSFQGIGGQTNTSGDRAMLFFNSSANQIVLFAGSVSAALTANDSVVHSVIGVLNGASSIGVIDGTATTGLSAGATGILAGGSDKLGIVNSASSQPMTGNWFETGIWASGFNATQYGNMATNMANYY